MPPARRIEKWRTLPLGDPAKPIVTVMDRPSGPMLLERIRTEAEVAAIGRLRFAGTLKQRNALWRHYRNFLRQAISNYEAALDVGNRSAMLLYYYAMLNFAKAELLQSNPPAALGAARHGLRANVTKARSVAGDSLTVQDGVFRALYRARTGRVLPMGTNLPVRRLLERIPEIGDQLAAVGLGRSVVSGLFNVAAMDATTAWTVISVTSGGLPPGSVSAKLFGKIFTEVDAPNDWKDMFAVSRRWAAPLRFFETRSFPIQAGTAPLLAPQVEAWRARDILETATSGTFDAWLVPSMYNTKLVPMPPSLSRYAIAYYASTLVRYRPSMFDSQVAPSQAFLFDAISRECSLPMLADTIAGLTSETYVFIADDAFRN